MTWLVVYCILMKMKISRDAYLKGAAGDISSPGWSELEEDFLTALNIREQALDYVRYNDALPRRWVRVHDYDIDYFRDMGVIASTTLVACGHGQLEVEAALYIVRRERNDQADYDNFDAEVCSGITHTSHLRTS